MRAENAAARLLAYAKNRKALYFERNPATRYCGQRHQSWQQHLNQCAVFWHDVRCDLEGLIEGTPAIGFSLCDYSHQADFSHTSDFVRKITRQVLEKGLPKGTALNVNIPPKRSEAIKGIRIGRQANAKWVEDFDQRFDPNGRSYFWMTGNFVNFDKGEDNDEWAIANNYVSVVPCQFDLTAHQAIPVLNEEWNILG